MSNNEVIGRNPGPAIVCGETVKERYGSAYYQRIGAEVGKKVALERGESSGGTTTNLLQGPGVDNLLQRGTTGSCTAT